MAPQNMQMWMLRLAFTARQRNATPGYRQSAAAVGAVMRGISNCYSHCLTAAGAWRISKTSAGSQRVKTTKRKKYNKTRTKTIVAPPGE